MNWICANDCTADTTIESPASKPTIGENDKAFVTKEGRSWCVRPIPADLCQSEIYGYVNIAANLRDGSRTEKLATKVCETVQEEISKTYTAGKSNAKFVLNVFVSNVSDGSVSATVQSTGHDVTWLGEAFVGLTWTLWPNTTLAVGSCHYVGGSVSTRQDIDLVKFFNVHHHGAAAVANIAPEAAYMVVRSAGIGNNRFYKLGDLVPSDASE